MTKGVGGRALLLAAAIAVGACSAGGPGSAPPTKGRPAVAAVQAGIQPLAEGVTSEPRIVVRVLAVERAAPEVVAVRLLFLNPDATSPVHMTGRFAGDRGEPGSLAGLFVTDETLQKKYFVMRDDQGRPQCTTGLQDLPPGGRIEAWGRFAGPSGDAKITLNVPGAPPFPHLPVSDPPGGRERALDRMPGSER